VNNTSIVLTAGTLFAVVLTIVIGLPEAAGAQAFPFVAPYVRSARTDLRMLDLF